MSIIANLSIIGVGALILIWIIVSARKSSNKLSNKKIKKRGGIWNEI